MITPDEPWMCGNLTTMPWEPGSRGGGEAGEHPRVDAVSVAALLNRALRLQSLSGYHARRTPCARYTSRYTVKWISVLLHY